jgi:predicted nucleic acid-binding protein
MTEICFVDTNVLVYWRDVDETLKQPVAAQCLSHLWQTRTGRTSVQVLSEYFTVVTKKMRHPLPPDKAWADVETLLNWTPASIDVETLQSARTIQRRYRLNWWDCLVVASAQQQGCSVLLSEDLQHGSVFDGLTVRNPFKHVVEQETVGYQVKRSRPAPSAKRKSGSANN